MTSNRNSSPQQIAAVTQVLIDVLDETGRKAWTRDELQKLVDTCNASISRKPS